MKTSMEAGSAAIGRSAWAFLVMLVSAGVAMAQTPLIQETTTLSSDAAPIESDFSIPQSGAGQYQITLTDLGATLKSQQDGGPGQAPLDNVHVVITRGTTLVAKLDGNTVKTNAVATALFDATPGSYKAHIAGKPGTAPGSGPVGLKIASVASPSTSVLDLSGALIAPPAPQSDLRSYQAEVEIPADGDYEMTLADLKFPRDGTLETAGAFMTQAGSPSLAACLSIPAAGPACPSAQTVHLTAGKYQLIVAGALLAGSDAGVFAMHVTAVTSGAVIHSRRVELGSVKRISESALQLSAGDHTLSFKDLLFPASLSAGSALIATGAQATAVADLATIEKTFSVPATTTPYDVFVYATADATAATGSFVAEVKPVGSAAVLSVVQAVGDPAGNSRAFVFPVDLTAGGAYRTKFGDFQFPVALSGSRIAVVQNGALVGKTDVGASATLSLDSTLVAGRATVLVVSKAASAGSLSTSGGTFGLEMALAAGQTPNVLEVTQGIGGLVSVRKVSVTSAGRYDITISDLAAPAAFNDLMMVVSRGATKLGTLVVGSGGTKPNGGEAIFPDLDASTGNYSITLIATPNATVHASTYGILMATSPGAPTVTLTATPTSVNSGATVGLTWTSQSATSCVATSVPNVWSGAKALSGTDSSSAVTQATTFTLKCTDAAGRSTEKTASVSITAQNNNGGGGGGGGGAFDVLTLLALTLAAALHLGGRASRNPQRPHGR